MSKKQEQEYAEFMRATAALKAIAQYVDANVDLLRTFVMCRAYESHVVSARYALVNHVLDNVYIEIELREYKNDLVLIEATLRYFTRALNANYTQERRESVALRNASRFDADAVLARVREVITQANTYAVSNAVKFVLNHSDTLTIRD